MSKRMAKRFSIAFVAAIFCLGLIFFEPTRDAIFRAQTTNRLAKIHVAISHVPAPITQAKIVDEVQIRFPEIPINDEVIFDLWQKPILIEIVDSKVAIRSGGADRKMGTEDDLIRSVVLAR